MKDIIKKHKTDSLKTFNELNLPTLKNEKWKYTDVSKLDLENLNDGKQEIIFPDLNDELKEKKIIFTTIKDAIENYSDLMIDHAPMSLVKSTDDKFTAMHASFYEDGIFIYVPKNTTLSIPLRNKFKTLKPGKTFSHTLIIIEDNSQIDYIEEHESETFDDIALRNDVIEIHSGNNSKINFHNFQKWNHNVINITNWCGDASRDSSINWIFGQFGGKLSRIRIDSILNGEGSTSNTHGVFFSNKKQHFDITTDIFHNVPNTTGDILIKGVLDDSSTSVFRGKIKILKDAQNTNSYLSNHSLVLSENATSYSIPSLEIDANDVKASHGATLGKPDENEIFYLMARGLSRIESERLIILGYFSPIIEKIKFDDLKLSFDEELKNKVSKK